MSLTVVIDYGSGNLRSAAKALERAARDAGISTEIADCRRGLAAVPGMEAALAEAVLRRGVPFLGICVGMQLMATRGREFVTTEGLGWIAGEVVALAPADKSLKIPHMGWNALAIRRDHPVLAGLPSGTHAYFVHSYHLVPADPRALVATTDYGGPVAAAVGRDNLFGVQFHPEKSQAAGLRLIANFLGWQP